MKINYLIVATLSLIIFCFSTTLAESKKIEWLSYKKGMELSKTKGKKIYINFHATWCGPCKIMKKNTFSNPYVIKYLNDNFIPIRVDIDKENKIASKLRVRGVPTSIFFKENGDKIAAQPGYIPPLLFEKILAFINSNSYATMNFDKFSKTYKRK